MKATVKIQDMYPLLFCSEESTYVDAEVWSDTGYVGGEMKYKS
jgi:hypothetical protein